LIPGLIKQTEFPTFAILALAIVASGTDLFFGRIYNWLTLSMGLLGVIYAGIAAGWPGVGAAFLGIFAGLLIYGWMFWIRVLGGGDVKLLMAFGAWGGAHYVLNVAFLGILFGGVMALLVLVFKGRIGSFFRRAYRFIQTLMVRELEVEKFHVDKKQTMPFGIPIAVAAVCIQMGRLQIW
jgi:prepilin peptidase CpaA